MLLARQRSLDKFVRQFAGEIIGLPELPMHWRWHVRIFYDAFDAVARQRWLPQIVRQLLVKIRGWPEMAMQYRGTSIFYEVFDAVGVAGIAFDGRWRGVSSRKGFLCSSSHSIQIALRWALFGVLFCGQCEAGLSFVGERQSRDGPAKIPDGVVAVVAF